jgi:SIS domain protein
VLGQSAERILKLDIPKFESAPGTRSYMVCVMALYLLAIRIGEVRGRYTMDVASARRKEIKALADALETALPAMDDTAFAVAQQWKDMDCYDFAGSGFEYACAFFGQAKVFEAIGRPAMYINTEEWLHLNFFVNHPEKIGTMIWAAEDNKADSRTLETIGYAKQLGRPLAIVTDREMPDETQAAVFVIPKAKNVLAESLYNFVPACLVFGYLMTMLGERSGRGCEGPWSFSKGAACVRQSEIVMVDD